MTHKKSEKIVKIVARYALKTNGILNGIVCYRVRASKGTDTYCTTLVNGKSTGCTCPAYGTCYHITQLEAIEALRTGTTTTTVAVTLQTIDTLIEKINMKIGTQVVKRGVPTPPPVKKEIPVKKDIPLAEKSLRDNKGFSLLR